MEMANDAKGIVVIIVAVGAVLLVGMGSVSAALLAGMGGLADQVGGLRERMARVETRLDGMDARLGRVETRLASIEGAVLADADASPEVAIPESPAL